MSPDSIQVCTRLVKPFDDRLSLDVTLAGAREKGKKKRRPSDDDDGVRRESRRLQREGAVAGRPDAFAPLEGFRVARIRLRRRLFLFSDDAGASPQLRPLSSPRGWWCRRARIPDVNDDCIPLSVATFVAVVVSGVVTRRRSVTSAWWVPVVPGSGGGAAR